MTTPDEAFEQLAREAIEQANDLSEDVGQLTDHIADGATLIADIVEIIGEAYSDTPTEEVPDHVKETLAASEMWLRQGQDIGREILGQRTTQP